MSLPTNALPYTTPVDFWLAPDDDGRPEIFQDYEMGGVGIQDPSQGLVVKHWYFFYLDGAIRVSSAPYTTSQVLITIDGVTELSGSFDQNMNPAIAYVVDGQAYYYWYETATEMQITTTLAADVRSPFVSLDDKRGPATTININDDLLFYIRGTSLYYRQQREQYSVERLLYSGVEPDQIILRAGMSRGLRFQLELGPVPTPPVIVELPKVLYEWRHKRAAETTYIEADFISRLPDLDWVVSCDVSIIVFYGEDADPDAILLDTQVLRSTLVTQCVTGGIEGNIYLVTFTATSGFGNQVALHTILSISSPPIAS